MKKFLLLIMLPFVSMLANGQEQQEEPANTSFYLNADIVNRYLWRGLMYSSNVNIQPTAGITAGNFFAGAWGSYAVSDKYAEVDFFMGYSMSGLTFTVSDYYTEDETNFANFDHFHFKSGTTNHALEGSLSYNFGADFPLTLTAATFFYGNDRNADGENYYSTYFEGSYAFDFSSYNFSVFMGGTPAEGLYAPGAAIINLGLTASKSVPVNEQISIPVSASLVSNPKAEDIFFIVKLTL